MPTIPPLAANNATLRTTPFPGQDVQAAELPGEAMARLGEAAANIGNDLAQKQIQLQRMNQFNALRTSASLQIDQLSRDEEATSQSTDQGYLDHEKRVTAGLNEIQQDTLKSAKDPAVRSELQNALDTQRQRAIIEARDFQRKAAINDGRAQLSTSLLADSQRATDSTGPALADILTGAHQRITDALHVGVITPEDAAHINQSFRSGISQARALGEIRRDAVQAYADLQDSSQYQDLTPVERQHFIDQAAGQATAVQRENLADSRYQDEQATKLFNQQRDDAVTALVSRARNGQLTLPQLEEQATQWHLKREDYGIIRDELEHLPTTPSNPAVLHDATIGATSVNPTVTNSQLQNWYTKGQLSRPDYLQLNEKLIANSKGAQDQTKSDIRYRQSHAEESIKAAFGANGPLAVLDEVKAPLSLALTELSNRSSALSGQEDPLIVAPQVIKKYLPLASEAAQQNVDAQRKLLQYPTPQALGPLAAAQARGMTVQQWNDAASKLRELDSFQQEIKRMNSINTGAK